MKWQEIKSDFINDVEKTISIDAWKTSNPNEEGKVIAKVRCDTKEVIYLDETAKTDIYAQEVIQEVLNRFF